MRNATTSLAPVGQVDAAFCSEADGANLGDVTARCDALGEGYDLSCFANVPGPTCREQLAGEGIDCPTAAAPALSPTVLAAAVLLLAAIGRLAVRRR